jgi:Zn-dependent protease/predicted transcriptional regulator
MGKVKQTMNSNVKLGRIFGIPVGLHWSWFIIFILVTWSLSTVIFKSQFLGLASWAYWGLGIATSLLLFVSILAHEFGHALVSVRNHIGVERITLFIFGGLAQIEQEPQNAGAEFRIAIAGPLVSLMTGLLFDGIHRLSAANPFVSNPSLWLAQVNYSLAIFNMIPGFPLDGGRVMRAALWAWTKNYQKSTRIATYTGQLIAYLFIAAGLLIISRGGAMDGLWLIFIGWFLRNAAASSREMAKRQPVLDDVRVTQIMDRRVTEVPSNLSLNRLVEEKIVRGGNRSFLVAENNQPIGLVTIRDIISIPRQEWDKTCVNQVMTPWERLVRVSPDAALANVLQSMQFSHLTYVPVVAENRVEGLLTREQIIRYLNSRGEFGL